MRLKKLEEAAERKAYEQLVKDIAPKKGVEEPFSSYKDQLGFGKHFLICFFLSALVLYTLCITFSYMHFFSDLRTKLIWKFRH